MWLPLQTWWLVLRGLACSRSPSMLVLGIGSWYLPPLLWVMTMLIFFTCTPLLPMRLC